MCGLLGLFRISPHADPLTPDLIKTMRDTMSHRGPDDNGLYVSNPDGVALAHRRLSIIDLSKSATQPMFNEDGSLGIVFNGEIYNHAELRPELEACGAKFKTHHSDTEVILKGYQEWGEDILSRLRGMFAFAIWDKKNKKVWLARDRMGVKPLYTTTAGGYFLFASEIKALLAHPDVSRSCDEIAFQDFLTFLVSPAPRTLFKGISKLPASHTLTVYENGRTELKRYWNPFNETPHVWRLEEDEWVERILFSLKESVRYRMVSDVNFGVFLSGGIDSSLNVALMAEQMSRPVDTFSIGFKGQETYNELRYARLIRDRFHTRHHEIEIEAKDLLEFLPKMIFHQDEPIADPVCVPVYYVSKLAKDNGTTVCQVGEGADELFCGYPSWGKLLDFEPWAKSYRRLPGVLRKGVSGVAERLAGFSNKFMRPLELVRRASYGSPLFWGGVEAFTTTMKDRLLSPSLKNRLNGDHSAHVIQRLWDDFQTDAPPEADELHWMSYLDLRLRLPELLLMRVDKMTMATAVEARVPFLDQEFVRLAMRIPRSIKYKDRTLKYILKKAVRSILPAEILDRPKQGFAVPVEEWFQQRLRRWSEEKITEFSKRTDFFKPDVASAMVQKFPSRLNWFLLNFVLWHEMWIEKRDLNIPSDVS